MSHCLKNAHQRTHTTCYQIGKLQSRIRFLQRNLTSRSRLAPPSPEFLCFWQGPFTPTLGVARMLESRTSVALLVGAGRKASSSLGIASPGGESTPALGFVAHGFRPHPRSWFPNWVPGLGTGFLCRRCFVVTQVILVPSGWSLPCPAGTYPQGLDPDSENSMTTICPVPVHLSLGTLSPTFCSGAECFLEQVIWGFRNPFQLSLLAL